MDLSTPLPPNLLKPSHFKQNIRFVLVRTQFGGNAGATARALKNTGFSNLDFVRPAFQKHDEEVLKFAVGARDLIDRAQFFDDLPSALQNCQRVIGTSRRRGGYRKNFIDLFELPNFFKQEGLGLSTAIVFGTEADGLANDEAEHCQHLLSIPSDSHFQSYNLSQAVLLVAFELFRVFDAPVPNLKPDVAPNSELEGLYGHLFKMLDEIGFLRKSTPQHMPRILRNIFGRARLSPSEVRVLRGICRQVLWYKGKKQGEGE